MTYNYLYKTQGEESANEFFDDIRPILNARVNEENVEGAAEFAEIPVISDIATFGSQLVDGVMAPVKFIGSLTGDYEDNWASYDSLTTFTNTVRSEHAQYLNDQFGTEAAGFVYNTVMSIGDMAVALLASKGIGSAVGAGSAVSGAMSAADAAAKTKKVVSGITQAIMSSEAATQTMSEARARGLSGWQVAGLGLASATIEALTEKYSLDALFWDPTNAGAYILKNIVAEGSEEAMANVWNTIADQVIAGNQSALKQQIQDLMAGGMSYRDATQKVLLDKAKEIGLDALGGALSGTVMGGGSVAIDRMFNVRFSVPSKYSGDLSSVHTWVTEKFSKLKNGVNVRGLGTVMMEFESMMDSIQKTKNADQAVAFAAVNSILHKGTVNKNESGTAALINTGAYFNGKPHAVAISAGKMQDGRWLITGLMVDGEAVYDASVYAEAAQTQAQDTDSGVVAQEIAVDSEVAPKLVAGEDGQADAGFDYDGLNRITQASRQQAPARAAQGRALPTSSNAVAQTPAFEQQNSATTDGDADVLESRIGGFITKVSDFVNSVLQMKDKGRRSKRKAKIGDISQRHANLISDVVENITGKDVDYSGYEIWMDGTAAVHLNDRHGTSGEADQTMQLSSDLDLIPWVVNNADEATELRNQNGEIVFDHFLMNSDRTPALHVKLSKEIDGETFFVVECVPDAAAKRIYIKSAYKSKKTSGTNQLMNLEPSSSQHLTSETSVGNHATDKRITQENPPVNTYDTQNSSENSNPDVLESRSYDYTESKENWTAENRNEGSTAEVESLDAIVSSIEETFGVPINKGNIRQKKAAGIYKTKVQAIRTQLGNALPTICHELGHHLDRLHKLTQLDSIGEAVDVMKKTNPEFAKLYGENQQKGEAVAEFIREYLRDRTAAKQKYPKFFAEVINALGEDLGKLNAISDKVNAYMYASMSEHIAANTTNRTNARQKKKGFAKRMKSMVDKVIEHVFEDVIAIRDVSEKAYKGVYDARKAATVVDFIINEGMVDVDGNYVEGFENVSLSKILEPINNIQSKGHFKKLCESITGRHESSYDEFGAYLVLKRGLDLAGRDIPIFGNGDPSMQDPVKIQQEIDKMEAEYPEFKEVADQLYAWEKTLGQTYYVKTGRMSQVDFDAMWERDPHYVPFNRT